MEIFNITSHNMHKIAREELESDREEGFNFFILDLEEWDELSVFLTEAGNLANALQFLCEREVEESRRRSKEGALTFRLHFDRLSPQIHYICLRDIDEQGKQHPCRIFLTPQTFIMFEWNGLSFERLNEWAQEGTLSDPLELASALGLRILHHHQKHLEIFEDQMDVLEEEILTAPRSWQLKRIIVLHRRILNLKRSLNAHSRIFDRFKNIEKPIYGDQQEELIYEMRRALDHVHQTYEMLESLREAYQAAIDNRSNDIMKLLTLLATILLPITLLTSFFGMNFEYLPLIHRPNGLVGFYGLSLIILLSVVFYFWKRKWLRS